MLIEINFIHHYQDLRLRLLSCLLYQQNLKSSSMHPKIAKLKLKLIELQLRQPRMHLLLTELTLKLIIPDFNFLELPIEQVLRRQQMRLHLQQDLDLHKILYWVFFQTEGQVLYLNMYSHSN